MDYRDCIYEFQFSFTFINIPINLQNEYIHTDIGHVAAVSEHGTSENNDSFLSVRSHFNLCSEWLLCECQ